MSDVGGHCTITDLNLHQDHSLKITAAVLLPTTILVHTSSANMPLTVTLPAPSAIECIVREADGRPAMGALVHVQLLDPPGGQWFRTPMGTDGDGRALVEQLPPGRYVVWATREENAGERQEVELRAGVTADVSLQLRE